MSDFIDLTGIRYNKLKVVCRLPDSRGATLWECLCDCGNTIKVSSCKLKSGHTKSCGCIKKVRKLDLVGKQFGRLTVLKRVSFNKKSNKRLRTWWECLCTCGKYINVFTGSLTSGNTKSCGCLNEDIRKKLKHNLINRRFGKLTVLERIGSNKNRVVIYKCICDCGNTCTVTASNLTRYKTQSCGCLSENPDRKEAALFRLYYRYKSTAKAKNREFSLTQEQFKELVTKPCFYCNSLPEREAYTSIKDDFILANGIDRVDSSKGYTIENCVPCCITCNKAKTDTDKEEFILWVKKVYTNILINNL